jgi:hypothetical protein
MEFLNGPYVTRLRHNFLSTTYSHSSHQPFRAKNACSGDGWSVPVVGAVLSAVMTILIPHKLNCRVPRGLSHWSSHNDFPCRWDVQSVREVDGWEIPTSDEDESNDEMPNWRRRMAHVHDRSIKLPWDIDRTC